MQINIIDKYNKRNKSYKINNKWVDGLINNVIYQAGYGSGLFFMPENDDGVQDRRKNQFVLITTEK